MNNRYYSNAYGRFMTPDPYKASGGPGDPQSWNKYAYTRGDPVNRLDPGGTCDQDANYSVTVCSGGLDPLTYNALEDLSTSGGGFLDNWWSSQIDAALAAAQPPAAHVYPLFAPGTTQNQEQALDAGINSAWAHLLSNPQCASFLTGNPGGSIAQAWGQLAGVIDSTTYSFAPLAAGTAAQTNMEGGNQVTISTSGIFFQQPTLGNAVFVGLPNAQGVTTLTGFNSIATLDALVLLHELGHETGVLPAEGNDEALNGQNSAAILSNCFTKGANGTYQ